MIILFGVSEYIQNETADGFDIQENKVPLAAFETEKIAKEYIDKSKTINYKSSCSWRSQQNNFKTKSLLHGYLRAEIEYEKKLPINPILDI